MMNEPIQTEIMSARTVRVIKQNDPLNDRMPEDLYRLANSMRRVLVRHYPDPDERQDVAVRIMQKVRGIMDRGDGGLSMNTSQALEIGKVGG